MFEESISIMEALKITVLSMSIVFSALWGISEILNLFKVLFYERDIKKAKNKETKSLESVVTIEEKDEEIHLVVALMSAVLASDNQKKSKLKIKSIKRVA